MSVLSIRTSKNILGGLLCHLWYDLEMTLINGTNCFAAANSVEVSITKVVLVWSVHTHVLPRLACLSWTSVDLGRGTRSWRGSNLFIYSTNWHTPVHVWSTHPHVLSRLGEEELEGEEFIHLFHQLAYSCACLINTPPCSVTSGLPLLDKCMT